ncbi:RNA polymerase sigma factor [Nocardia sp. N2S4-5]|uniref:RNA polymerase sigma factor n=1 Tax=Nocardia sp. N2S4-5 TaxID=3351565 RepID=UPI0037D1CCE5
MISDEPRPPTLAERDSFEKFVRAYFEIRLIPTANRYAAYRCLPSSAANDIAAEALARIWEKGWSALHRKSDDVRLASTFTYMENIAREMQRTSMRSDPRRLDLRSEPVDYRLEEAVLARSALKFLASALQELSDEQQLIISLTSVAGLNHIEIAARTGLKVSNVGTILHRARSQLKQSIPEELLIELGISTKTRQL